jgi:hypothetical protein
VFLVDHYTAKTIVRPETNEENAIIRAQYMSSRIAEAYNYGAKGYSLRMFHLFIITQLI